MQSNAAGASFGPRKRLDGMTKLLDRSRRFVIPTMRREAYTPMTTTSTTMMTLNSNANTNVPNVTSMMSSCSSSTTNTTRVAYDAMENVNTNASMMTNTNASKMASVMSMMANSTRMLMANDTTVSVLASPTAAAAFTSVDTTTEAKRKSAATTATTAMTVTTRKTPATTVTRQKTAATMATKLRSAASNATKLKSAATLKRKYGDSDVSEYDDSDVLEDDFDDDDDPPPPPKKRKRGCRSSDTTFKIRKSIKADILQLERMFPFKNELLAHGAFGPKQWRQLYEQLGYDDEYVSKLFFSEQNKKWRTNILTAARDIVGPKRLGHVSSVAAQSAVEVGKTAPFTSTIRLDADDEANDIATANLVKTLQEYRNGNDDFEPPSDVASCFSKGDMDKAREFVIREYNSIMAHMGGCYAYGPAMKLAAEVKKKYGLSSKFPTFEEESYVEPISFTSAEVIEEMCELPREGLDAKIRTFLNKSTALEEDSDVYKNALLLRTGSVLRIGSIMKGLVKLLYDGNAALVPLADGSYAIVTMGTPEMLKKGWMPRKICPGAAIRNRGDRYDNEDHVEFDPYLLVSFTRSIVFNTNAHGQFKCVDDTYGARTIEVDGKYRLFRRMHETRACSKPCDEYQFRSELVRYQLRLHEHGNIVQHQFNLIYATACGIGTESLEYIYAKLRSKEASSNMAETCVNPEDRCDGDHCFHRLMMISNSIYFCFPVDHSTNRCCSYHRMNANDWCYTLTVREYMSMEIRDTMRLLWASTRKMIY